MSSETTKICWQNTSGKETKKAKNTSPTTLSRIARAKAEYARTGKAEYRKAA